MSVYGPIKGDLDTGYKIQRSADGWRRVWIEPGEEDDCGPWLATKADALREAADDWATNGAGQLKSRLAATLRALATRAEAADPKEHA